MSRVSIVRASMVTMLCLSSFAVMLAQLPEPDGGTIERGTLPAHWLSQGSKCMEIPEWQVHEYNSNFFILRQSPCTDYEKPFVFLFFGKDKALLADTGSRNGNIVPAIQLTVKNWLARNGRTSIPLLVVHTHEHGDHVWGDKALQAMNDPAIPVTLLPAEVEATKKFYGIGHWPTDIGHVDLGGRVIDVIPIPGHSVASVAFYDRNTAILLSSDSLYPGRLYVQDFAAFQASTERLIAFTKDKPVAHVLGNHIEETRTPFKDFPIGSIYHPNEHVLELSFGDLLELEDGLKSMEGAPHRLAFADFTIWPTNPKEHGLGAEMEQIEKRTQEEQLKNKWNQPQ